MDDTVSTRLFYDILILLSAESTSQTRIPMLICTCYILYECTSFPQRDESKGLTKIYQVLGEIL